MFENESDIDALERMLEALVRLAPFPEDTIRKFSPVLKRARTLKRQIAVDIADFVLNIVEGEGLPLPRAGRKYASDDFVYRRDEKYPDYFVRANSSHALLIQRLDSLAEFARQGHRVAPLSTASHRRGFISPSVLAERLASHFACGAEAPLLDQVTALLRLAPGADDSTRAIVRALPDSAMTRAFRYALGDDVPVGPEKELFATASRIRHPGTDDPAVLSAFPELGPNAGAAATYRWLVSYSEYGSPRGVVYSSPPFEGMTPGCLSTLMPSISAGEAGLGAEVYIATLQPSDLEGFFAHATRYLSDEMDWGGGKSANRMFLAFMQDPTIPFTLMAVMALALGLACKDAGEAATAADAFVTGIADGRLDVTSLGTAMRNTLYTPLGRAARYRKSLEAAAKTGVLPRQGVFDLLNQLMLGNPEEPRKDLSALLELLLELKLELRLPLDPVAASGIAELKIGGKGKALQKALLAN